MSEAAPELACPTGPSLARKARGSLRTCLRLTAQLVGQLGQESPTGPEHAGSARSAPLRVTTFGTGKSTASTLGGVLRGTHNRPSGHGLCTTVAASTAPPAASASSTKRCVHTPAQRRTMTQRHGAAGTGSAETGAAGTGSAVTGAAGTGSAVTGAAGRGQPARGQPARGQPARGQPARGRLPRGQPAQRLLCARLAHHAPSRW